MTEGMTDDEKDNFDVLWEQLQNLGLCWSRAHEELVLGFFDHQAEALEELFRMEEML